MGSAFTDAHVEPTDALVRDALGPSAEVWERALALLEGAGARVEWRYYRDGGWLAKATRGGQTVAWLSVEDGILRVAFYFAERHRAVLVDANGIPDEVRARISDAPMIGKVFPVAFEVRKEADLTQVENVLAVKVGAK